MCPHPAPNVDNVVMAAATRGQQRARSPREASLLEDIERIGAERDRVVRKGLPRTGNDLIDSEAVVVQACLRRLHESVPEGGGHASQSSSPALPSPSRHPVAGGTRVICTTTGKALDITHRTQMGAAPEQDTPDNDIVVPPLRTDTVVAQAALPRLMRMVAERMKLSTTVESQHESLADVVLKQSGEIHALRQENAQLKRQLEVYSDPNEVFQAYRRAWVASHARSQDSLAAASHSRNKLVQSLLDAKRASRQISAQVAMKRHIFHSMTDQLAVEFARDELSLEKAMCTFFPPASALNVMPSSVVDDVSTPPSFGAGGAAASAALTDGDGETNDPRAWTHGNTSIGSKVARSASSAAAPAVAVGISEKRRPTAAPIVSDKWLLTTGEEDDTSAAASRAKEEELLSQTHASFAQIHELTIHDVLGHVDELLQSGTVANGSTLSGGGGGVAAGIGGGGGASSSGGGKGGDEGNMTAVSKALSSEALIVTRRLDCTVRTVREQDPNAALIGTLLSVLLHSPSTFTILLVEMTSAVGRHEQIARHAALVGFQGLWDEMCVLGSRAALHIVDCTQVANEDTDTAVVANSHPMIDFPSLAVRRQAGGIEEGVHAATASPFVLSMRNAASGVAGAGAWLDSADTATLPDGDPRTVAVSPARNTLRPTRQPPGVVSLLAHSSIADDGVGSASAPNPTWTNPISTSLLRVYSSSMLKSCSADGIVRPFIGDLHSPFFCTEDQPGQHIDVSLQRMLLVPTAYSIASTHPIKGGHYPRNWRFEASLDGRHWVVLRDHVNDETLSRNRPMAVFHLGSSSAKYYQHFRMAQTGRNAVGTNHLCVCSLEVYGRLLFAKRATPEPSLTLPSRAIRPRGFAAATPLPPLVSKATAVKKSGGKK